MDLLFGLLRVGLSALTLMSILYYSACLAAAAFFFRKRPAGVREGFHPPVTLLIPLCGADSDAYRNYSSFISQDYPEYQVIFGVRSAKDPSVAVVRRLMRDFPGMDVALVVNDAVLGENPKVSNLANMLVKAKYDCLLIADSDIRVGRNFLKQIIPPLGNRKVGLVTCLYKGAKASSLAAKLEFIGISAEFAPGVLLARVLTGMDFALGAVMAMTREKLNGIGGFEVIADYLADDYMLGHLMRRAGHEVRLSPHIVEMTGASVSLGSMLKYQIRWGRGIRAYRPLGHLGLIISHGTVLALLNLAVCRGSLDSILLLAATLAVRLWVGWFVGVRRLDDGILRKNFGLLPLRDLLSFGIWCLNWAGRMVEWRGKRYRIVQGGKITAAG